jgi:hypothetical protein
MKYGQDIMRLKTGYSESKMLQSYEHLKLRTWISLYIEKQEWKEQNS